MIRGLDLLRYSCQLALPGFTEATQRLLQNARVLIVGAGGLGCPCAQYLAASGAGTISVADDDVVSVGNLHRQILYGPADIGKNKAVVASEKLRLQNPSVQIIPVTDRITAGNALELVREHHIVVDATDNFETRYLLNDTCVLLNKPLVYGAIYQYEGQLSVWNILNENGTYSPNYRDVYPEVDASQIPNCAEGGVMPTLAGIIGCMQANEVIKYITGAGTLLAGKMLVLDAATLQSRLIKLPTSTRTHITHIPESLNVPTISIDDFVRGMKKSRYELVDVRSMEERDAFNIGGRHIPLPDLTENLPSPVAGKPIIFYCASGKRSAEAVRQMKKRDQNADVFSLRGGMKAWMEYLAASEENAK